MKITLVFVQIFLMGLVTVSAQIPTAGLIGKYSFSGNADNEVSNYANGVVSGATLTVDRCGDLNSAYHFSTTDDHIAISIFNRLINNDLSLSLWAKADILSSNCMVMLYPDNWNDRCVMCAQYLANPSMVIWDLGNCDFNGRSVVSEINYSDEWHHYVFINSQSQNSKAIYMDSVCLSSQPFMDSLIDKNRDLYIGAGYDWSGGGIGFRGSIDDLRIYNRALEASEVSSLFHENLCNTGTDAWKNDDAPVVNIFPVPASEKIKITGLDEGTVEIIDLQGKLIQTFLLSINNSTFDISMLSAGVYLAKITTTNRILVKKLIIKQ